MWNWLYSCYRDGSLTLDELEKVMEDDDEAKRLWEDWAADSDDFIDWVREQVIPFLRHVKGLERKAKTHG
jgi:hypothetical protein